MCINIAIELLIYSFHGCYADAQGIGVSYTRNADNLPKAKDVVALCKSHNVRRIRLHDPRHDVLQALKNTGIKVILGVGNDDIMRLATDARFAGTWVRRNVLWFTPYINFRCIAVGDENILANTALNQYVLPAMIGLN